jgi:hypothetical protein
MKLSKSSPLSARSLTTVQIHFTALKAHTMNRKQFVAIHIHHSTNALSNRPQIIVSYYPAHPQSIISSFAQVHIPSSHNRTPTTTTSGHATCTTSQRRIFSMMLLHYNHLSRGLSLSIIWLLLMMSAISSILLVGVLRRALALVGLLWRANVWRCLLVGVACGSLLLLLLLLLLLVVFV